MRYIELRRHTDNDGDRLTSEGVAAAQEIARTAINPPYSMFVSTGTWRTGEMLAIIRKAAKQEAMPIIDEPSLRSEVERRWREAIKAAGSADLEDVEAVDPELVEKESWLLGLALRGVMERVPQDGRALVIGHSPMNEAAIAGLTGLTVDPLGVGAGVLIVEDAGKFEVSYLD